MSTQKYKFLLVAVSLPALLMSPCIAATKTEVTNLNNLGVAAVNESKWQTAVDAFTAALKIDPAYKVARQNLAIAEDKWGWELKSSPKNSLVHLHKAFLLSSKVDSTPIVKHVDAEASLLGHGGIVFQDRVTMGDVDLEENDYTGAAAEYLIALSLHDDSDVRKKLDDAFRHVESFYRQTDAYESFKADTKLDDGAYLSSVEQKIKEKWAPAGEKNSRRTVVQFEIDETGKPLNVHIAHSSHQQSFDDKALESIQNAGSFGSLPKNARGLLSVQMAFDYDAVTSDKRLFSDVESLGQP